MQTEFNDYALAVIGDIHGEFQSLLKILKPLTDTVVIVAGDCGMGFPDTRKDKISKMIERNFKDFLNKRNLYLFFIRGNHDYPPYFAEPIRSEISTERFILLEDYTTLTVNGKTILCIGGAVSVDRRFRKLNTSYWYAEEMIDFNPEKYDEADVIVAHTINREYINYHLPPKADWLRISFKTDQKLSLDTEREDLICEKIMQHYRPAYWIHGHYHISAVTKLFDTKIVSLNINELYEIKI